MTIGVLIDIDLTSEYLYFQQTITSNTPAPRCSRVTLATDNTGESSLYNVTRDSSAARRLNSNAWCAMPSSSTSTVCWGITTFTCSIWGNHSRMRRISLDRQNDKDSQRKSNENEIAKIFEFLNNFIFKTQRYKINALFSHVNNLE